MFPLQIDQYNRKPQFITWALILINAAIFGWELRLPAGEIYPMYQDFLVIPANIVANPFSLESFLDIMRSTFMHADYGHIIGNMLYLHLFGTNVERRIGHGLFLFLYLIAGFTSALLHVFVFPEEMIPLLGASGAISGMLGLFLILFPKAQIRGMFPIGIFLYPFLAPIMGQLAPMLFFFIWPVEWSAWAFLGLMLFNDVSGALNSLASSSIGGVAHFGHLGGFIAGISFGVMIQLALLTRPRRKKPPAL